LTSKKNPAGLNNQPGCLCVVIIIK